MLDVVWLNIVELSKHEPFTALLDKVRSDQVFSQDWLFGSWENYDHMTPLSFTQCTTGMYLDKWPREGVEGLVQH